MQRNVRGCTAEVCRLCHYGCQLGAKQSTLKIEALAHMNARRLAAQLG